MHKELEITGCICRQERGRILFLELGVGMNTSIINQYPFWKMTAQNSKAAYACLNYGQAVCPREIHRQTICINEDIGDVLSGLYNRGHNLQR